MAKQQKIHETKGNLKSSLCNNLGIQRFNSMTSSEYPALENYQNKKKELNDKIYNHDILY